MASQHSSYTACIRTDELGPGSPMAEQPKDASVTLRPHQLALLHRCREYESEQSIDISLDNTCATMSTRIGVIGDAVGSGKSYVVLALAMESPPVSNQGTTSVLCSSKVVITKPLSTPPVQGNTLLVVPHSICSQWECYVKSFSKQLHESTCVLNRTSALANLDVVQLFTSRALVIVTAPYYNRLASFMYSQRVGVRRLVFDEADSLRIPACLPVDNAFTWFVTASYGNLLFPRGYNARDDSTRRSVTFASGLTHSGYIRNIFTSLNLTDIGQRVGRAIILRNSDQFIRESIDLPAANHLEVESSTPRSIAMLYGFVSSEIIKRLNAGDVEGAMQCINSDNCMPEEDIVKVSISKYESEIDKLSKRVDACKKLIPANREECAVYEAEISRMTIKLKGLQDRIDGIRSRITKMDTCNICLDVIKNRTVVDCCSVPMCFACIQHWMHRSANCPFCKSPLGPHNVKVVKERSASTAPAQAVNFEIGGVSFTKNCDKLVNLESILAQRVEQSDDARFLICSSYDGSFDAVTAVLKRLNIEFAFLKGNSAQINSVITKYREGRLRVLLLNSNNYGSGMNLAMTTDVLMFHRFENELQKQVIGRAQRYGRREPLRLWYLLYQNEMHSNA